MKEEEVNGKAKEWIERQGLNYQGILSKGEIPVLNGLRDVLIDHRGVGGGKEVWVEAKGEARMSDLLEGFTRVLYALNYSGDEAWLAVPSDQFEMLEKATDFLRVIVEPWTGRVGILDLENDRELRL